MVVPITNEVHTHNAILYITYILLHYFLMYASLLWLLFLNIMID